MLPRRPFLAGAALHEAWRRRIPAIHDREEGKFDGEVNGVFGAPSAGDRMSVTDLLPKLKSPVWVRDFYQFYGLDCVVDPDLTAGTDGRDAAAQRESGVLPHSTVTDFARFRGWSTSCPSWVASSHANTCSGRVASSGCSSVEHFGRGIHRSA